jgi:class 3 adenylate cyclase
MLTSAQERQVSDAVERGLNRAEATWKSVGRQVVLAKSQPVFDHALEEAQSKPSSIPGHPWVSGERPTVDEFVALVVDMRNSSEHLKSRRASAKIEYGFQRVYYETSALLPAVSVTCAFNEGVVTEYLGDGALILFRVDPEDRVETIRQAYRAAKHCVGQSRDIVNRHLQARFDLPEIHIGAGLSMSKALISLVGDDQDSQPKAIGECVWEATKLSGGTNTVHVSESVRSGWPSSKGGLLRFIKTRVKSVDGYRVASK